MPTTKNTPKKSNGGGFGPGRGLGRGGEKPKDVKKALGDLAKYVKPWYPAILVAAIAACGGAYLTIIGPDRLSEITNKIISKGWNQLPSKAGSKPMISNCLAR